MSQALCFNETTFNVIDQNGTPWLQARQIGHALGYSRPDAILNIYERNKDEFSLDMTTTIELMVGVTPQVTRIFSLRGCHLLAMFARTPVAKAFRVWVLDVLDKLNAERSDAVPTSGPLSPAHRSELKGIVDAKLSTYPASVQGKARSEIWTRFNRHFRIAEYAQLPAERMAEARDYLIELEVKALKALPSAPSTPLAIENSRIPNAMEELRKLVTHCGIVRNIIHMECHPGAMSFSMSAKEREVHYAFQGIYQTAVDNICAATHALDTCLKLRAIYPARG